jgi:chromate transport protein ChrA
VTETASEIIPLFGQHHAVIQRVLAWSTLTPSGTLDLSLGAGAYVGNRLNAFTTIILAGLITALVAYYLVRGQSDGIRWLMHAYAAAVVSVVLIFSVKFFRSGSTPERWDVAPVAGVATVALIGTTSFLRRSKKPSTAGTKGIERHGDGN